MGTILEKGFPEALMHTVHSMSSQNCLRAEVAFPKAAICSKYFSFGLNGRWRRKKNCQIEACVLLFRNDLLYRNVIPAQQTMIQFGRFFFSFQIQSFSKYKFFRKYFFWKTQIAKKKSVKLNHGVYCSVMSFLNSIRSHDPLDTKGKLLQHGVFSMQLSGNGLFLKNSCQ